MSSNIFVRMFDTSNRYATNMSETFENLLDYDAITVMDCTRVAPSSFVKIGNNPTSIETIKGQLKLNKTANYITGALYYEDAFNVPVTHMNIPSGAIFNSIAVVADGNIENESEIVTTYNIKDIRDKYDVICKLYYLFSKKNIPIDMIARELCDALKGDISFILLDSTKNITITYNHNYPMYLKYFNGIEISITNSKPLHDDKYIPIENNTVNIIDNNTMNISYSFVYMKKNSMIDKNKVKKGLILCDSPSYDYYCALDVIKKNFPDVHLSSVYFNLNSDKNVIEKINKINSMFGLGKVNEIKITPEMMLFNDDELQKYVKHYSMKSIKNHFDGNLFNVKLNMLCTYLNKESIPNMFIVNTDRKNQVLLCMLERMIPITSASFVNVTPIFNSIGMPHILKYLFSCEAYDNVSNLVSFCENKTSEKSCGHCYECTYIRHSILHARLNEKIEFESDMSEIYSSYHVLKAIEKDLGTLNMTPQEKLNFVSLFNERVKHEIEKK